MKLLLAAVALLPLAVLSTGRGPASTVEDPPPFECPFCGGNAELHMQLMCQLTAAQARIGLAALGTFY